MLPAIGQVCSLEAPFERDIEDYASGKCGAVEIWFTKLERYLESHSPQDVVELLEQSEIIAPVASLQGGLLTSQGAEREAAWELFENRLNLCQAIGVSTMVLACDCPSPMTQQDLDRLRMSLEQAAENAERSGVLLALEFQARSAFGNNLQTAAALVEDVGRPSLGVCLDAFHFFVGPSMTEDLSMLNTRNLFHVQFCDVADAPREFASDSDRILPGEGDIPLRAILDHLRTIQYQRYISLELMNPQIWRIPPLQFGEIAMTAMRLILGQANHAVSGES